MKKILFITGLVLLASFSAQSFAAAYVKLGDIKGESMAHDSNHDKWIVIESVQFSNGMLVIKHKNGKKERLQNGMYKFKDGRQFMVKNGKAKLVKSRGKRSIIRAKTKTTSKPGIEHEDIGRKREKKKDGN